MVSFYDPSQVYLFFFLPSDLADSEVILFNPSDVGALHQGLLQRALSGETFGNTPVLAPARF